MACSPSFPSCISRAALPFIAVGLLMAWVLIVFQELALWFPKLLYIDLSAPAVGAGCALTPEKNERYTDYRRVQ